MQRLIKPFLFAVARLGLFLAVVAWIVGQFWQGSGQTRGFTIAIDPQAIGMSVGPAYETDVSRIKNYTGVEEFLDGPHEGAAASRFVTLSVVALYIGPEWAVAVRHRFSALTFFAFNLILHWIYRKRSAPGTCED